MNDPAPCHRRFAIIPSLGTMVLLATAGLDQGLPGSALGQSDLPPFPQVRAQFERNLSQALLPELRAYARQLLRLEQQLAERSDWKEAARVRDERRIVLNQIDAATARIEPPISVATLDAARDSTSRIELLPASAVLENVTIPTAREGSLTAWSADSKVTWQLPDIPPGGYEVVVEYNSESAASLVISEDFFELDIDLPATDAPGNLKVGTLKLRTPSGGLRLEPEGEPPGDLQIQRVVLIPASQ